MIDTDAAIGVISVSAGSAFVKGEVRRAGDAYVNLIDGAPLGGPTGLDFSIYRLTTNIRLLLPVIAPSGWYVTTECERSGRFVVAFGDSDFRFDADDSWREEIWAALQEMPRHTLSDAIESAAELVRLCVRPTITDRATDLSSLREIE